MASVLMTRVVISPDSGENEAQTGISPVDPTPLRHGLRRMAPVPSGVSFAGFDEDDPPTSELGPGDSHYELTDDTLEYAPDGSGTDWPTISPPAPSPFEPQPDRAHEPETSKVFFPDPWYDKLIDSWGRFHFIVPLGLGAVSLAGLCFLLVLSLSVRPILDSSISALVVGLLGTIAFLLICLTMTALSLLLLGLARDIRRLRIHADRSAGIERE